MARTTGLLLVVMIVLVAGCAGVFGGQETTTPTATPTTTPTDTPTKTATDTSTSVSTSTSTPASTNTKSYTLFSGGDPRSNASLGPRTFVEGKPLTVNVSITNGKNRRVNYTTVIQLVRFNGTGPNAAITERRRLDQFTTSLESGANRTVTRTVTPNTTGQELLLMFLLYKSDPPATPTSSNSHMYFATPISVNSSSQQASRPSALP
jgi:hypothetical protein